MGRVRLLVWLALLGVAAAQQVPSCRTASTPPSAGSSAELKCATPSEAPLPQADASPAAETKTAAVSETASVELPDAPSQATIAAAVGAPPASPPGVAVETPASAPAIPAIATATAHKREGEHWGPVLAESAAFLGMQHAGNLGMIPYFRWQVTHGNYFHKWFRTVENWRWTRWNDDDPFLDDYIGHPLMGSVTNYIWIQNDPSGRGLTFENTHQYWHSRMRAFWYSAAYSAQWKIGPFSEASIGNNGMEPLYDRRLGHKTWGSGMVDFVMTPVGGTVWTVSEDVLDRYVTARIERWNSNPLIMLPVSILTPSRTAANILRLKAPWYRDYRRKGQVVAVK